MRYCRECVLPDTKPHVKFDDEGVCDACRSHREKNRALGGIDWDSRAAEFDELIERARAQRAPYYDVMVPVSGGKDSITQVHRLLDTGLRILAVNVDYGIKTEVGWHNLGLVAEMGAHLSIYRPSRPLQRSLIRLGLEQYGDPDLLSHCLLHAYPLHMALRFEVPLCFLGENPAFEYGGEEKLASRNQVSREWFDIYAANSGWTAERLAEEHGLPTDSLRPYAYPEDVDEGSTVAVFASHFFHWDSQEHLHIAERYGFESLPEPREGTFRTYVGIDEKINRLHQYLKLLKFGYGRATDHACEEIRNGRMSRKEAVEVVRQYDLVPISDEYMDDYCDFLGYSRRELVEAIEKYRNPDIWTRDDDGGWAIRGHLAS